MKKKEEEAMPRRLKRRHHFSKPRLLAFSSFARSIAQSSPARKLKRPVSTTISKRKRLSDSRGKRYLNDSLNKKENKMPEHPESSDEEDNTVIQADFAFFDPKPADFHGVKILLQTYLDDTQWDLSGFVDLILEQTTVGTVVKIDDEEEDDGLFAVVTAMNLGRYKDHECIVEIKEFVHKVCQGKDVKDDLELLLGEQAQDVGLLVSQRVVNLPPVLLPPLYDALFDEVSWAIEDEPTQALRDSFHFKFYLLITRIYKHKNADQQKGQLTSNSDEAVLYIKPEDEFFHKLSSWSFTFPVNTQPVIAHALRSYRSMGLIMVLKADQVPKLREELKLMLIES